ncbi:hypothetical protein GPECTOR_5g391 [Gonium pectorale]|uniref:Small ribosomal subunit protein bS18c n=1 Tax=Gonium pectorale TaxID=33097 RepID=A0A150GWN3_GONPE|nr:hypothetical protein GPECTOR_5g391 [Gonium pectorale]|eukprot:KXZ54306.1 hypothetical protein GPECTOR_5g391 [Gonium pectorale]
MQDVSAAPTVDELHSPSAAAVQQQQPAWHRKYGYAALGGVLPSEGAASGSGAASGLLGSLGAPQQQPRIHPRKRFLPGTTYEPQDLNPFAAKPADAQRRSGVTRPSAAEVKQKADYKNVAFLTTWFLSPAGRLLPRKETRLPVQLHRHVSRQVKLARHMGLIAGETRLDKMHLARLREEQLREAQQRALDAGALAAAGGGRARPSELLDFGA